MDLQDVEDEAIIFSIAISVEIGFGIPDYDERSTFEEF